VSNYPSQGGVTERGTWFWDSEGNLLSIGRAVKRAAAARAFVPAGSELRSGFLAKS